MCPMCGGYGVAGGCPRCGKETGTPIKKGTKAMPTDIIPAFYQGKVWEKNTELAPASYYESLAKVHTEFQCGRVPAFSLFMASPDNTGKHLFAYSCMQASLSQGYSVAPMLTLSDWRRLYKVSQMNPFYKMYSKYTWDELIGLDVIFMMIDHSEERVDAMSTIKDILDTRANFSKPTFIISDYKLNSLVSRWKRDEYTLVYNPDPDRDLFRYPVVIHGYPER